MAKGPEERIRIRRVQAASAQDTTDVLSAEEPMELRIVYGTADNRVQKNLSVTMRTPGNDTALAVGFLFTEGIITQQADVLRTYHLPYDENVMIVELAETVQPDLGKLERHFYTTSSCGVCGKSSIDAVRTVKSPAVTAEEAPVPASVFYTLPNKLREQQEVFETTGGLHASALFDHTGNFQLLHEDVGRHNALDKVIGAALEAGMLPLHQYMLLLSGRASFELIQKAAMAGIKIVAAVGAPSGLAVQLAAEFDITLVGFLRGDRFNIYTGVNRVIV